jgi:hypothetical protein
VVGPRRQEKRLIGLDNHTHRRLQRESGMSALGTGIFDDDVACDTRALYRASLKEGQTPAEATQSVLRAWKPALDDAEDGPVIWLALAALQCQYGCLEPQVKAQALAVIDNGSDLEHWRATGNPNLVRSRVDVLARLRAKLEAPPVARTKLPKKPKRPRVPFREEKSAWPLGEVVAYRLQSGRYILLHVCGHSGSDRVGWAPMFAVLNWRGKRLPPVQRIQGLPYKKRLDLVDKHPYVLVFSCGRARESELSQDRVVRRLATRAVAAGDHAPEDFPGHSFGVPLQSWKQLVGPWDGYSCSRWRDLDRDLEEWLGWK